MSMAGVREMYLEAVCLLARKTVGEMMGHPDDFTYGLWTQKINDLMATYGPLKSKCNQNMDANIGSEWTTAANAIKQAEKLTIEMLQDIQIENLIDIFRSRIHDQLKKDDGSIANEIRRTIEMLVVDVEKLVAGKTGNWCRGLHLMSACVELSNDLMHIPLPVHESVRT